MSTTVARGRGGASAPTWTPTRIGQARPSHLITTGGVGAVVDLPQLSVVVRGTDTWSLERAEVVEEPRLLEQVRAVLGSQVRTLRSAPWDPKEADEPGARTGVPVSPFPRWVRCPVCHRLGPIDPPGQFVLSHPWGRRPDLAKYVHATCGKQANRSDRTRKACIPARFAVTCDAGHLDDFPWVEFVHRGTSSACAGPRLVMRDSSSTLGPRVTISCVECDARRQVQEASGRNAWEALPACRGRHPHLQQFEDCRRPLRLTVLGASNLWFSVTASALHLPVGAGLRDRVAAAWQVLGGVADAGFLQTLIDAGTPVLRDLADEPVDKVWEAVEAVRAAGGPEHAEAGGDLLDAEWQLLAKPTTEQYDPDFQATPTPVPAGREALLDQVVLVSRLREVQALLGFTRGAAPERGELSPQGLLPLARSKPLWVPAVEQRGEGVFLQLPEDRVAAWAEHAEQHPRVLALHEAYRRWCDNREQEVNQDFPVARYLLVHTLSHLLMREVALECGYGSSSLRERLYVGRPDEPSAGVLLMTAASDSEGTLGGLVSLGRAEHLGRLLDQALEDAGRCSSDPLCAEHTPGETAETLHNAACHACLFASETSCEANNRWLDRAVLVDLTGDGLAYPR